MCYYIITYYQAKVVRFVPYIVCIISIKFFMQTFQCLKLKIIFHYQKCKVNKLTDFCKHEQTQ